jgi:hypothetical protein
MLASFYVDWSAWWQTVTPEFAFLLALPFIVAAAGWIAERMHRHK